MTSVHLLCHQGVEKASETMRKYHTKKVKPAPVYQPGNLVMLNGKPLKTRRPARNLNPELQGPFQVTQVMSPAALKLELPLWWSIYNPFHVTLLELISLATDPIWDTPDLNTVVTNEHESANHIEGNNCQTAYEVEEIMGSWFTKE